MKYLSTDNPSLIANFEEAVFKGLPDSKGLFMPVQIFLYFRSSFFNKLSELSLAEIGFQVLSPYVGSEINESTFKDIVDETLSFSIPLNKIHDEIYSLELYHGPTLAFKDVGARFFSTNHRSFCNLK